MTRARRLIWIVNHRTLLPAEIPIFRELGYEVLIPKIVPSHDPAFRSSVVTDEYDVTLSLPADVLEVLNRQDFYEQAWSPRLTELVNEHFDVIVTSISSYVTPLVEAARHFDGRIIARVFGREDPRTYTEFFTGLELADVLPALAAMGDRFVFGQGFDSIAPVEGAELRRRAHTITVPLPRSTYQHADTWRGDAGNLVLLCPEIATSPYYREIYDGIERDFGDLPHVIFGRQSEPVDDARVLPYLTEEGLFNLYAAAPAFVYPSAEPRHVHYSPIEAMVVGTPVLYRRGGLIDMLAGARLPGACADTLEMRAKAEQLLAGDGALAGAIRDGQQPIVDAFSVETAARQWKGVLLPDGEAVT
jgi:glycosyltransferase involved in cell wall biosynthesis